VRVWSSTEDDCLPGSVSQEGIFIYGTVWGGSLDFDRAAPRVIRRAMISQALRIVLALLCVLGAGTRAWTGGPTEALARISLLSRALSPCGVRIASGPEIVGRAEAAVGAPTLENESRLTAEVLHVEPVHSSQLNIAPPQIFTRIRLRLLAVADTPGTPSFLMGREGAVVEAYTREQVNPGLIGKKIECRLSYRGDERGGLYWLYEIRALPGNS
jgi:hypothetical protein